MTTTTDRPQAGRADSQLDAFWDRFHLLPSRFARFAFRHWYLFTVGFYLLTVALSAVCDFMPPPWAKDWWPASCFLGLRHVCYILTYPWLIAWYAAVSALPVLFNTWRRGVAELFQDLYQTGRVAAKDADDDLDTQYLAYLEEYQRSLYSPKRYVILVLILAFVVALDFFEGPFTPTDRLELKDHMLDYAVSERASIILDYLLDVAYHSGSRLPVVYFGGVMIWAMFVTGRYIRHLTDRFDLVVQPSHPDRSGGLQALGDCCLGMAVPILYAGLFLAAWGTATLLWLGSRYVSEAVFAYAAALLITFPLAMLAFFAPLRDIHRYMVRQRRAYQNEFANWAASAEARIRAHLEAGNLQEAEAAAAELRILQSIHPDAIGYPTWPFNRGILLKFWSPQIASFAASAFGLFIQFVPPLAEQQ